MDYSNISVTAKNAYQSYVLHRQYATRVIEIENGRAAKSLLTEEYFARKG
jgi:hypothetical protein